MNGNGWKGGAVLMFGICTALIGFITGGGFGVAGLDEDLGNHVSESSHNGQLVWNGRMEVTVANQEALLDEALDLLQQLNESNIRIEAQLGIEGNR